MGRICLEFPHTAFTAKIVGLALVLLQSDRLPGQDFHTADGIDNSLGVVFDYGGVHNAIVCVHFIYNFL